MKAADLMTTNVVTIADDATAQDAAVLMLGNRISALPVLDRSGKLVGIVSEGDLMRRSELGTERERSWWLELLTANRNLASDYVKAHGRKVSEVMTRKLITATPDTPINVIAGVKVETPVRQAGKDAEIREEILARLSGVPWRPWLFNVTVHDGVVDLWGIANAAEEKNAAGVAAENAPGVFSVNNHIIVRPHNWAQAKPFFAGDSAGTSAR